MALIDTDDLRKVVAVRWKDGTIVVRSMTTEQATATREEALDAEHAHPGDITVQISDVSDDTRVGLTPEAAEQLLASVRSRRAHPAL